MIVYQSKKNNNTLRMKTVINILLLMLMPFMLAAQERMSKADSYFYGYEYGNAIAEYKKEQAKNALTTAQLLNFADSYFKLGQYKRASELYLEVNKKDTIMSNNRFNNMLQSLSKVSERERVRTFLQSKSNKLSKELLENAAFNYELLDNMADTKAVEIKNLGINGPQADFSPSFYKDQLLFSSGRPQKEKEIYAPSGESYLDIYVGKVDGTGNVTSSTSFSKIPSTKFHKATPYFSESLSAFFYILSNTEEGDLAFDDKGKNALAIGMVGKSGSFRFLLKDLGTSFYYPFFDDTTDRLYFAANFKDGYGGTDIYYVVTNNGQIMSAPVNLGPKINSPGNEIAPYLFKGSLYFSSDVFYGLGGMDIYKSNEQPFGGYSIPVNLGKGINSEKDDFGLIIASSENGGYHGYFASNRNGGKGKDDIYSFQMASAPGLKTFSIHGRVVNTVSGNGIDRAEVRLLGPDGMVYKETITSSDGSYSMEIPWQEEVIVQATKNGYSQFSKTPAKETLDSLQAADFDINLVQLNELLTETEGKSVIKMEKFFFDKGKSDITPSIATALEKVIYAVKSFPDLRLSIESHTDSRGSTAYNKALSQKRSDAIKGYLLKNGLSEMNIVEAVGYGEEQITNNCINGAYCLEFLHKQNERTLVVVK
jgi:outer membrane protein OmpA-like peptidoglycan-associated protein